MLLRLKSQESSQTLPPSRNTTPPKLPSSGIRSSVEKFIVLLPPIGRPEPLSGETSNRPQPRRLVEPPRKYRLKKGTGTSLPPPPSPPIDPPLARTASTARLPTGM